METLAARSTLENMPAETKGPSQPRQTGLIGRYIDYFSKDEIELMDSIMGANLTAYGYDVRTPEGDRVESHVDRHVA